jgi:ADP-heptose:LPS heptosyltransferase
MSNWSACKNILCIRADNMGDVIMSGPAMRALKDTFGCTLTLLTSAMGSLITPCLPEIDEVLIYNVPWIKANATLQADECLQLIADLQKRRFDAAVIFTAYSQSALPAAMLAFLANIPLRLAYCRENPYELLTHWVPDKEPYSTIKHQVKRDLELVASVGAHTQADHLLLQINELAFQSAFQKLKKQGVCLHDPWIVVHTGVSEKKREYPVDKWIDAVRLLQQHFNLPVLLTGSSGETEQARLIQKACGKNVFVVTGLFTIEEFIAVVKEAQLVISVNTATIHIAAATGTPVIVLYALTNPQHTPWNAYTKVLPFPVHEPLKSKNEIIKYVNNTFFSRPVPMPEPAGILQAAIDMLQGNGEPEKEQRIITL